jgi:hypothetical protein
MILLAAIQLLVLNAPAQTEAKFKKETSVIMKAGISVNIINRQFYKQLNEGFQTERYQPINSSWFVNPYASVGIEYHYLKRAAIQFNMGFYQSLQKYLYTYNYVSSPNLGNQGVGIETTANHLNNNVFIELLPAYVYKQTRILAGANVTRSSATVLATIATINASGQTSTTQVKDRLEESYHMYSLIGIQQGFLTKRCELILSVSYYGLFRKYDSGLQASFGVMF